MLGITGKRDFLKFMGPFVFKNPFSEMIVDSLVSILFLCLLDILH